MHKYSKPHPLGLTPFIFTIEARLVELDEAIARYESRGDLDLKDSISRFEMEKLILSKTIVELRYNDA